MSHKESVKEACDLDSLAGPTPPPPGAVLPYLRVYAEEGGVCLILPACPWEGGGCRAGNPRILAEQTHGPPSTLSPLCTQGVRPGSMELHFMVTKTTMPPSRNCQQCLCAQVFGPIFAEPEEPRLLCDIDLESSRTRKSGVPPGPSCRSAVALGKGPALGRMWGVLENQPAWLLSLLSSPHALGVGLQERSQEFPDC